MTRKLTLITLFYLSAFYSVVMGETTTDSTKIKDNYIGKTDTLLNVRLNGSNDYEWFNLKGDNFEYDIRPNISLSNRISVSYRIISFGFSFRLPFIPGNNDNDLKGKSKSFGFGMEILGDHLMQKVNYSKSKGFYLYNSEDIYNTGNSNPNDPNYISVPGDTSYITVPDLKTIAYSGYTGYKFNKRFSFKALTSQSEIQLKSSGSFVVLLDYRYQIIDNKSNDSIQKSSQRSGNLDVVLNAGYFYTFVISKKFYVAAGAAPGYGFKYTNLLTRLPGESVTTKYTDPVLKLNLRAGLGYNTRKFFAGIEFYGGAATSKENRTTVTLNNDRVYAQIFVGYRFRAPNFVNKQVDVMEQKMQEGLEKLK